MCVYVKKVQQLVTFIPVSFCFGQYYRNCKVNEVLSSLLVLKEPRLRTIIHFMQRTLQLSLWRVQGNGMRVKLIRRISQVRS